MRHKIKIAFLNWWSDGTNDFFRKFIESYMGYSTEIVNNNPDIIFFSVFHKISIENYIKNNSNIKLRIFFTGEDTLAKSSRGRSSDHYYLNIADISLGFKHLNHPNYLRFPLWLTYINVEKYNMGKTCLPMHKLINFNTNDNKQFTCIISNHDQNNTRTHIIKILNNYKQVTIGGNILKHNKDITCIRKGCGRGEESKQKYLNNFKFNICSESSINPGYVTEKLFECIIGGCIPIYYCEKDILIEPDILNNDFIIKYTDNNYDEVLKNIVELDKNKAVYNNFINKKPLVDNAYNVIISYYEKLKNKISEKLNQS